MKKGKNKSSDELRPEYNRSDFTTLVRGKYAARLAKGSNIVVLEPEVAEAFPSDKSVNDALRALLKWQQPLLDSNAVQLNVPRNAAPVSLTMVVSSAYSAPPRIQGITCKA